jgi:hypothetical protein
VVLKRLVTAQLGGGAHLDLQVAGGQFRGGAVLAQQHVGEDGQGVTPLDDAGNRLQGTQQLCCAAFKTIMSSSFRWVVVVGTDHRCGKRHFHLF